MKRIIVYYTLSGNTEEAVKKVADKLGCEAVRIDTVKPMPKAFLGQIIVGGGQVAFKAKPELKPISVDFSTYDEIFIGTPIWNGKCVPAFNTFLKDKDIRNKVTGLIITSGSGKINKCIKALGDKLPNFKYRVSLVDKKGKDAFKNDEQIENFVDAVEK